MKYNVLMTEAAERDVRLIYEYIAEQLFVPDIAFGQIQRIEEGINGLAQLPERWPLYREEPWHSRGLRFLIVDNYLVFYLVYQKDLTVVVTRVLYGKRSISDEFNQTESLDYAKDSIIK